MLNNTLRNLALMLLLAAPAAHAESLGEAINRGIGPVGAEALAEIPADFLNIVHASSSLMAAHSTGLVSNESAASAFGVLARKLEAIQPQLEDLEDNAYRVALILQGRVFFAGVEKVVRAMEDGPDRYVLAAAINELTQELASSIELRVQHTGGSAPNVDCFQKYGECMEYCSNLGGAGFGGVVERSLCGMDCNLQLAVCLGGTIGGGIGELLGSSGGVVRRPALPSGH